MTFSGIILSIAATFGLIAIIMLALIWLDLDRRLRKLENAQHHRNPYRTNDGIEDAIAILLDTKWNAEYLQTRLIQAQEVLKILRADPDQYDSERPNGKKAQP